jgi:Rad3-related DNA helicase
MLIQKIENFDKKGGNMQQLFELSVTDSKTPRDYGLNHDEWRSGQREAIEWVLNLKTTGIVAATTGTGKTSFARALSQKERTIALVRTKLLQQENYEHGYGFAPLYGRSNYDCIHEDADYGTKADSCLFSEQGMLACGHGQAGMSIAWPHDTRYQVDGFKPCPYMLARESAKQSQRSVLNYAYWLNVYERWSPPKILVCDEGHQLSDLTLEWAGTTVSDETRTKWGLTPFPMIRGASGSLLTPTTPATERAIGWIEQSLKTLRNIHDELIDDIEKDEKTRKQVQQVEVLGKKLRATLDALKEEPEDWYIKSGPGVQNGRPAFVARPLTARHHFKRYFINSEWRLLIMSATIGDPAVFATELGITDYEHMSIPSQFAPEERPVMALDVPRIGHNSTDKEYGKQADEIAKAIKDCPGDWSGIIHTTSTSEAPQLAERLAKRGLQDRVWVAPKGASTEQMVAMWHQRARSKPGSINVSWAMWEGYDPAPDINLKICITAKVPYAPLNDEYEIARRSYDGKLYLQRAAWQMEQGLGRSRRGRKSDYDLNGQRNGLVCIADGSWKWIRNYFSQSLRESVVTA